MPPSGGTAAVECCCCSSGLAVAPCIEDHQLGLVGVDCEAPIATWSMVTAARMHTLTLEAAAMAAGTAPEVRACRF